MSRITRQQSSAAHDGLRERAVEFGVEALDDLDTIVGTTLAWERRLIETPWG